MVEARGRRRDGSASALPSSAAVFAATSTAVRGSIHRMPTPSPAAPDCVLRQGGLEIKDCGECVFCLDKPRYGGKGTKRQKCINKKVPSVSPVKAWASLRVTSLQQMAVIEE